MVEAAFCPKKTVLRTRPIYHKMDDTIRGMCLYLVFVRLSGIQAFVDVVRGVLRGNVFQLDSVAEDSIGKGPLYGSHESLISVSLSGSTR